jgi:hypothetical protein
MTVPADQLQAFIDGKLAAEEASGVAEKIAQDPELAAYVEDQRALKAALASPAIGALARAKDRAAALSASWIPAAAMAAGIALGVALAGSFGIGTEMRASNGALIAQGELAHVLTAALSSDDKAQARIRVGASFWSKNGAFCRSFVTRGGGGNSLAGLACRDGGGWRIPIMAAVEAEARRDSPVGALLPSSVRAIMENLIVGEPLSEDAERQARAQGWRPG